jgi:alanine racemase
VGIAAYGADPEQPEFEPAMTLKSRLVFIKDVPTGRSISYDATYVTKEPKRVGVVSIGYGNGYPRRISGRGYVVIDGRPAPILGLVCMDQMMVDLNDHPRAKVGDTVLLFGRDGDSCLPVWEVAEWAETISYEVLCTAGAMTQRLYLDSASPGGKSSTGGE